MVFQVQDPFEHNPLLAVIEEMEIKFMEVGDVEEAVEVYLLNMPLEISKGHIDEASDKIAAGMVPVMTTLVENGHMSLEQAVSMLVGHGIVIGIKAGMLEEAK